LWSEIRKGKTINIKEDKKKELLELYSKVLTLYNSKPPLHIKYDYIARNGKWCSYEHVFAKTYAPNFNVSTSTISNILRKTQILQNEL
jgi:hypothetical protein